MQHQTSLECRFCSRSFGDQQYSSSAAAAEAHWQHERSHGQHLGRTTLQPAASSTAKAPAVAGSRSGWAPGDTVLIGGRTAVVIRDMRPKHNRATVLWNDTHVEEKKVDADSIWLHRKADSEADGCGSADLPPNQPPTKRWAVVTKAERVVLRNPMQ